MSKLKSVSSRIWPRVAILAAILAIWWIVYAAGWVSRALLPSPGDVWSALTDHLTGRAGLLNAAAHSVLRLAFGMAAAVVLGTSIGLAMAGSKGIQRSVGSVMVGLQAIPSIAWIVLVLIWLSHPARAIVAVVVISAFPAIAVATANSVRLVPPVLVRAGRTLGAKGWELQRNIVLPSALPGYFAGLAQAWALGWSALIAAELIVAEELGLGRELRGAGGLANRSSTSFILAVMVVIVIVGLAIDLLLTSFDKRIRRRRGLAVLG